MTKQHRTLGIIAGNGSLPASLIQACRQQKRPFFVLALKGHANPSLIPSDVPVQWIRLGAIGSAFRAMKRHHVQDVVLIGGVRRPSVSELCPDWRGIKCLARLGFKALGDDGLLRGIISEIESEGFRVLGIDDIVPSLVVCAGVLGKHHPTAQDVSDIQRGLAVASLLGQADVGQAVIVQQGLVLSVEGIEGTAALIARSASLKRKGNGGVLVKMSKPQQDRRVDLPTIGPDTVRAIHQAGFRGIAVQAGGVLVAESDKTIALANELGVFVTGV